MTKQKQYYGTVTVGKNSPDERDIQVVEYIVAYDKADERTVNLMALETEEFAIQVANPENSNRSTQGLFLTEKSLKMLHVALMAYAMGKGWNPNDLIDEFGPAFNLTASENL